MDLPFQTLAGVPDSGIDPDQRGLGKLSAPQYYFMAFYGAKQTRPVPTYRWP